MEILNTKAHGTVTRHYYRYLKGEETSTNPVATIFAWTGALAKRGELDQNSALSGFAKDMEKIIISMVEEGICTKDLAGLYEGVNPKSVSTIAFIQEIRKRITKQYSGV